MKRRNQMKRNIAVLCLVLVIALGTLGVGYASWSANVTIEETVWSGTWEAEFTDASCSLNETWADCSKTGYVRDTLTVITENVSECLSGNITFTITNVGTTPIGVTKVVFHPGSAGEYGTTIDGSGKLTGKTEPFGSCDWIELPECETRFFDLNEDGVADLSLHLQDDPKLIGEQFDPSDGDPDHVDGKIYFHVEVGTPNDSDLDFDIGFEVVPWNQT
jgi:hypothetical protein